MDKRMDFSWVMLDEDSEWHIQLRFWQNNSLYSFSFPLCDLFSLDCPRMGDVYPGCELIDWLMFMAPDFRVVFPESKLHPRLRCCGSTESVEPHGAPQLPTWLWPCTRSRPLRMIIMKIKIMLISSSCPFEKPWYKEMPRTNRRTACSNINGCYLIILVSCSRDWYMWWLYAK